MALTLIEAAKVEQDDLTRAVIEIFAQTVGILRVLPFDEIPGNALKYNREETLPGVGFRGVNEGFTESTGVLNPMTEALVIAGGDLDVDKFIIDTSGTDIRAQHEAMKVKNLAHKWAETFIKGDSDVNLKEYDGLQKRLGGSQVLSNGATSGGDPLSLANLDELIDLVDEATHLLMNKAMRRRIDAAARSVAVAGTIVYERDAFGRRFAIYADLPIVIMDENGSAFPTLQFTEAATGGGSTATSIYCVSLGIGMLAGIQNGGIDVRDIGELESKPAMRTRVEWYNGISLWHPRAAARLRDISNAPVVV